MLLQKENKINIRAFQIRLKFLFKTSLQKLYTTMPGFKSSDATYKLWKHPIETADFFVTRVL